MGQTAGMALGNVSLRIRNFDDSASKELGGVKNPEGLWGWVLCKNEILVDDINDYQITN